MRYVPSGTAFALYALLALFACGAVVHAARLDWIPCGDMAGIWLRTSDVGGLHTPSLGVFSRLGWKHPGPLLFYVLAVPFRVMGGAPTSLLVGSLLLALATVSSSVWLTARIAGSAAALILAIAYALLCMGLGDWIIQPWNPYVAVLPLAAYLVFAWLASAGSRAAVVGAAFFGSVAAQAHVGTVPTVALVGCGAVALRVLRPPPVPERSIRKDAAWLGASLALLWAPPVIFELKRGLNGNFAKLVAYFSSPARSGESAVGWSDGLGLAGGQLLPWGAWVGQQKLGVLYDLLPVPLWQVAVGCAPLVLGVALALRFRDGLALRLVGLLTLAVLASFVSHASIRGEPMQYLTLWSRSITMLVVAVPGIVLIRRLASTHSALQRGLALLIAGMAISITAVQSEVPEPQYNRLYAPLVRAALRVVKPGETVRVTGFGNVLDTFPQALAVGLESAGRTAKLTRFMTPLAGKHRTVPNDEPLRTLLIVTGSLVERTAKEPDVRLIYKYDPLPPAERAKINQLRAKLQATLRAANMEDAAREIADAPPLYDLVAPKILDRKELEQYLRMSTGLDRLAIALFEIPFR